VGDYLPPYGSTPPRQTRTAAGAITGGRLVTDDDVVAGANAIDWLGVASHDAASGESYGVYKDGVQRLTAAGAVAKGPVKCAANGKVTVFVPGTDDPTRQVGTAQEAAAADGDQILVSMKR
jgi:predicted RecA/RadA family phage recombinase